MVWGKVDQSAFDGFKDYVEGRFSAIDGSIIRIDKNLVEKTPELVEVIKDLSESASTLEAATRVAAEESDAILKYLREEKRTLDEALSNLKNELKSTTSLNESLKTSVSENQMLRSDLANSKAATDQQVSEISVLLAKAKDLLKQADEVPAKIESADELQSQCEVLRDNVQAIVNHTLDGKNQIDKVMVDIFGQDVVSSDGKSEHIDGIKDRIRKSFDKTDLDLRDLVTRAASDVGSVTDQLKALLPGGMAAGLSAAYEAKATDEIKSLQRLESNFMWSIFCLALVSLIPFGVDVYLLKEGKDLLEVLKLTPVLQIIPIYFPVLWFAYSTNKKVNLSKRLIEEYIHKSVLGKTFSGLSNQIDSLPEGSNVAHELRTRLLFNVLQVSAENPGKLISDYNKADHPVMEVLENSTKLSDSIDALQRVPGFKNLTKWLSNRKGTIDAAVNARVESGLDAVGAAIDTALKK